MNIDFLKIVNFRNIENCEVNPGEKINFIIGDNAQGKTNFIEAIYMASILKSFRSRSNFELIKNNKEYSKIRLSVGRNKSFNKIDLIINKKNKIYKVNDKKPDINFYNYLNTIIFHPDEIGYISNYPVFRRNLIDKSIFYTNFNYINIYKNYIKCLKHRNKLIKNKIKEAEVWEEQLINLGSDIIRFRNDYIDRINKFYSDNNENNTEVYNIKYSYDYENYENTKDRLREEFKLKRKREYLIGHTLVGPHKDDIKFYINNKLASSYASQGQKRSLILSFKTAQIFDFQKIHGYFPVLILDDMTSELDSNRKNILLNNLIYNSGQVFITSTDFKQVGSVKENKIFKVNNGNISLDS